MMTRRRVLQGLTLGAGAWLTRDWLAQVALAAGNTDPGEVPLLIVCTFPGGWDQMLALDPRDLTQNPLGGAVEPAYDLCAQNDQFVTQVLKATGGTGIVQPQGSTLQFGPAIGRLAEHWQDLCVIRALDMGTLTHEVGRRYMLTGKFPRGLQASGSSLPTWFVAQAGDHAPVPNLVVGVESYNEGQATFATGLRVRQAKDLLTVLAPLGTPLSQASADAVGQYVMTHDCPRELLDGQGLVTEYLESRAKAQTMATGKLATYFQFTTQPTAEIQSLYTLFHIDQKKLTSELTSPRGMALLAAQALSKGIAQAVSIALSPSVDHHDDEWQLRHAKDLRDGFDALADLIAFLKTTLDANGKPLWARTQLLVTSDFARAPKVNARGGRDHHLAGSCLIAGKGIRGNTLIGATDSQLALQGTDLASGHVDANAEATRPPDVHATLLHAAGMAYGHIGNQNPRVIQAALG